MNGNEIFLDTNVLIYLLHGDKRIETIIGEQIIVFSFISEMELLSLPGITVPEKTTIQKFVSESYVVQMNEHIKKEAIALRLRHKLKLPDAISAASAKFL